MWLEWKTEELECKKSEEMLYCENRGVSKHMTGEKKRLREGGMVTNLVRLKFLHN